MGRRGGKDKDKGLLCRQSLNRYWYHLGINGGGLLADTIAVINATRGDTSLLLSCMLERERGFGLVIILLPWLLTWLN